MTDMMISAPQRNLVAKAVRMPVIYEDAVRDLIACQTLDEAQYFADKAEALAAWARIHKSDQAGVEAKRLKLYAWKRIGELARELRPGGPASTRHPNAKLTGYHRFQGRLPGPKSILAEHGLSTTQSQASLRLSRMPKEQFDAAVNSPRPPSALTLGTYGKYSTKEWEEFSTTFSSTRSFCRRHNPCDFAKSLKTEEFLRRRQGRLRSEVAMARELALEITEWIDQFEQHLPKDK
jgi:hypothetical protein